MEGLGVAAAFGNRVVLAPVAVGRSRFNCACNSVAFANVQPRMRNRRYASFCLHCRFRLHGILCVIIPDQEPAGLMFEMQMLMLRVANFHSTVLSQQP